MNKGSTGENIFLDHFDLISYRRKGFKRKEGIVIPDHLDNHSLEISIVACLHYPLPGRKGENSSDAEANLVALDLYH